MNDIVNDKKGHNIVNNNFAHKPVALLVAIAIVIPIHPTEKNRNHNHIRNRVVNGRCKLTLNEMQLVGTIQNCANSSNL